MKNLILTQSERMVIIEKLKSEYPVGTRIELIDMNDPYTKIPKGTKGTVSNIDDMATIHVKWDNGSSLGVVYGEDKIKKEELQWYYNYITIKKQIVYKGF